MTQDDEPLPAPDDGRPRALDQEFELDHPPERVWEALIRADLLARWLLPCGPGAGAGGRLERGVAFSFAAPPDGGGEGRVDCEVVEVEPGRRLACTWRTHREREARPEGALDALVAFEIDPLPRGGTRLRIRQVELPAVAARTTVTRLDAARASRPRRGARPPMARAVPRAA